MEVDTVVEVSTLAAGAVQDDLPGARHLQLGGIDLDAVVFRRAARIDPAAGQVDVFREPEGGFGDRERPDGHVDFLHRRDDYRDLRGVLRNVADVVNQI